MIESYNAKNIGDRYRGYLSAGREKPTLPALRYILSEWDFLSQYLMKKSTFVVSTTLVIG
jgi:hypothetical protein